MAISLPHLIAPAGRRERFSWVLTPRKEPWTARVRAQNDRVSPSSCTSLLTLLPRKKCATYLFATNYFYVQPPQISFQHSVGISASFHAHCIITACPEKIIIRETVFENAAADYLQL